jgi:hypothetical protein
MDGWELTYLARATTGRVEQFLHGGLYSHVCKTTHGVALQVKTFPAERYIFMIT